MGAIAGLPEALGGQLSGVFQTLAEGLGIDQLFDFFGFVGKIVNVLNDRISGSPDLETLAGAGTYLALLQTKLI